eukprot:278199-Prymnesium_polylepis.2
MSESKSRARARATAVALTLMASCCGLRSLPPAHSRINSLPWFGDDGRRARRADRAWEQLRADDVVRCGRSAAAAAAAA